MLECIQMGAFDFILKPFREPVIKTLFLVCRNTWIWVHLYQHIVDRIYIETINRNQHLLIQPTNRNNPFWRNFRADLRNCIQLNMITIGKEHFKLIECVIKYQHFFLYKVIRNYNKSIYPTTYHRRKIGNVFTFKVNKFHLSNLVSKLFIIVYSERKSFLQGFINDWNFSPLQLNEIDLVYCVFYMLDQTFQRFSQLKSLQMTNGL